MFICFKSVDKHFAFECLVRLVREVKKRSEVIIKGFEECVMIKMLILSLFFHLI